MQHDDLRVAFDRMVKAGVQMTKLDAIQRRVREAKRIDRRECGNCTRWMTSDCPQETRVKGRRSGPSMSRLACSQFDLAQHVADLKAKRLAECQGELDALGASLA